MGKSIPLATIRPTAQCIFCPFWQQERDIYAYDGPNPRTTGARASTARQKFKMRS